MSEENKKTLDKAISYGIIVIIVIAGMFASYGIYILARQVNYSLSYEDMVKDTVREMVKKECLND